MIGSWIAYLYNLLLVALRQSRLGQLILVLLSPAQLASEELTTYSADARLRSAATWQVMWLEKLLTDALGYTVTITEANGLPIDFIVSGISYTDETLARGLINRYKLAGKSYILEFANVEVTGQWLNPVCAQTNEYVFTGQWLNPVCAKEYPETFTLTLSIHPGSTGSATADLLSKNPDKTEYNYGEQVEISAEDNNPLGFFWYWEIYNAATSEWESLSNLSTYEITITGITEIRAFYSDMNQ